MSKTTIIILIILFLGLLYRLALTGGGNFLFNMDNARDFVDIREMIETGKLRLTGPTSAVDGFYNGPAWYYLLAIPYILTGGNPYGAILLQIILWAIGGFFLLKLVKGFGIFAMICVGLVWVASNYIVLANVYSFNPNPVTLLTPLFIYLLVEYLKKSKGIFIVSAFLLGGLFFNFEMNFGIFTPVIIVVSIFLTNKKQFGDKYFWIGAALFIGTLLPQVLFDIRHQFIMSKAIIRYLSEGTGRGFSPIDRFKTIWDSFYDTFRATMMNQKLLATAVLILSLPVFRKFLQKREDTTALVSSVYILVPFIGYLIIPVTVSPWHLGGPMAALLILTGFVISGLWRYYFFGKGIAAILSTLLIFYSISNIINFFLNDLGKPSNDPSLYKNEIAAIDYVYKYAKGQNFRVYPYLPSVYDYPYQYLFWWYGKNKYGYIPGEYVYSPNKPKYIPSQEKFQGRKDNLSDLVFLIKEPDRIKMRVGWENDYKDMEFVSKEMIGPIEVEIRREIKK